MLRFFLESAKVVVVALLIVAPIRLFVFQPFLVQGASMEPNFENGDYLIVDELSYRWRDPVRGEVIVFHFPYDTSQRYIKRVIGLPGETVEVADGKVVIYAEGGGRVLSEYYLSEGMETTGSEKFQLAGNEYVVLGDNRGASSDSRSWGVLQRDFIVGRALVRLLPLTAVAAVSTPQY